MKAEEVEVIQADWTEWASELQAIRAEVFIVEQGVSSEHEWDGLDEEAYHFVAKTVDSPPKIIGTARLLRSGQIGRMAVLPPYRKTGIGMKLLRVAMDYAHTKRFERIYLHSQTHAQEFYEKAGFQVVGDEFDDAGILHVEMELHPWFAT